MSKILKRVGRKEPAFVFSRKGRKKLGGAVQKVDFLLKLKSLEVTLLRQIRGEIEKT